MQSEQRRQAIKAIFDKRSEIHYNEWYIKTIDKKKVKLELQGKIKCPLFNTGITSLVCSKLNDNANWPRGIDPNICSDCGCYINLSIARFKGQKKATNV
jgi:hypothetical protein